MSEGGFARKYDPEFGKFAGLSIDLDRSAMLLDDNVVAQRETKTRSFAGGLRRKEGIEHLFLHLGRNASAVVTDPDFYAVAEAFGRDYLGPFPCVRDRPPLCARFPRGLRGTEPLFLFAALPLDHQSSQRSLSSPVSEVYLPQMLRIRLSATAV